jgi:hypothetical protein
MNHNISKRSCLFSTNLKDYLISNNIDTSNTKTDISTSYIDIISPTIKDIISTSPNINIISNNLYVNDNINKDIDISLSHKVVAREIELKGNREIDNNIKRKVGDISNINDTNDIDIDIDRESDRDTLSSYILTNTLSLDSLLGMFYLSIYLSI